MAYENSDEFMPPGYQRSRSALRRKFGQRAIDASAPYAAGKGPVSNMPGAMGGKTPLADWQRFFDRPAPVGMGASPSLAGASTAWTDPMVAWGPGKTDPSQAFRMAGAPPIGGPATGRSALTQAGLDVPMPATPTAMQYFQEGIKGAQPFVPGAVRSGDSFMGSGTDFARVTTGTNALTAQGQNPEFLEFLKRYKRA